jgi:hypothetical protein
MIVDPAENASAHLEEHSDGCASMVIATISIVAAAPDDGPSLVITLVTMIGVIVTTLVATSVVAGTSVAEVCIGVSARSEEAVTTVPIDADMAIINSRCLRRWLASKRGNAMTRLGRDKAYIAYALVRS